MPFSTRLDAAGSFEVTLKQNTPVSERRPDLWSWVVITPSRLSGSLNRDVLVRSAAFSGPLTRREFEGTGARLGGPSLMALLGSGSGLGPATGLLLEPFPSPPGTLAGLFGTGSFRLFGTSTRHNGLTFGQSQALVVDALTIREGTVFRDELANELDQEDLDDPVNLMVSAAGDVFSGDSSAGHWVGNDDPIRVMLWNRPTVIEHTNIRDPRWALQARISHRDDMDDYCTKAHVVWGSTTTTVTSSVRTNTYKAWDGTTALAMEATEQNSSVQTSTEAAASAKALRNTRTIRYEIEAEADAVAGLRANATAVLDSSGNDRAFLEPGDQVYVYEPDIGLYRTVPIRWAGQEVGAVIRRVLGIDFPILPGMGVYTASNNWATIRDLSPFVEYESRPMRLELGESGRTRTMRTLVQGVRR